MRAIVNAETFAAALKSVEKVRGSSMISELQGMEVRFSEEFCAMTATDLTTWMTAKLPAEGEPFSFLLADAGNLAKACRHFKGPLTLELTEEPDGAYLRFSDGEKHGRVSVHLDEACPQGPPLGPTAVQVICAADLYARVERIRYAASMSARRPALAGVRFQDSRIWCVDGLRAAVNCEEGLTVEKPFILPAESLRYLRTFGTQRVEMRIGEKAVQFASEDRELTVRRLFADDTLTLEEVFTKLPQGRHRVRRTELLGAIRYLQDAVGSKARATTCLQGTSLVVSGSTGQYGAELNMETPFEAKPTVDLRYMKEALEQFAGAEYVTLCVTDPPMPLFLFDESGENAAVVLPVRESASLPRQSAA